MPEDEGELFGGERRYRRRVGGSARQGFPPSDSIDVPDVGVPYEGPASMVRRDIPPAGAAHPAPAPEFPAAPLPLRERAWLIGSAAAMGLGFGLLLGLRLRRA